MMLKSQEGIMSKLTKENENLKTGFRELQKEMFEIIDLKSDIYSKRFKAEYGRELESEDQIRTEIEKIKDDLFSCQFDKDTSAFIVNKFKGNLKKLKEFIQRVDKDISTLLNFNQQEEKENHQPFEDITSKFSSINTVT
jgi:hypothetical protein